MGVEQGSLKEGSALRQKNVLGTTINPSTFDAQTDGTQKTQLVDSLYANYDINNPLPTDGDSVYIKDIDLDKSTKVGWTGNIVDLFDCPNDTTGLYNDTSTNPKVLYISFCRTVYLNAIGLGSNLTGKTFSNTKIDFIGSDGTVRSTFDDSTNNTKYGTKLYSFSPTACVAIRFSFLTANTDIGLSNITIQKEQAVVSRIEALKPSGTIVDVGATYQGSLKTSLSDDLGFVGYNTPIGEIRIIEPIRLAGAGFEGTTIDTNFWTTGATGTSASIVQANAQMLLTSGTSNGAYVYAYSVRRARYVSGSSMRFRCIGQLGDTGTTNNKRRWGIGYGATMPTITDGAWFQLDGTEFSVVTCKGGVETKVTSFNGNLGTTYPLSTNANKCEIYWTNSTIWFVLGGQLLHTVSATSATWSNTMSFHAFKDSLNSGVLGASVTMAVRTASIYRLGSFLTAPTSKYQSGTTAGIICKYSAGVIHQVIISGITNNAVVTIRDGTAVTDSIIWSSGAMSNQTIPFALDFGGAPFFKGLFFDITGANCNVFINYE